ncbi:MAG: cytochrome c maturation protein CcmE [Actinomycetota bacterium]
MSRAGDSPPELVEAGDKAYGAQIRLGGQVAEGSIQYADEGSILEFDVTDVTQTVRVRSEGVPPQMFRERIGVVVEGTMTRDGYFESDRLMVSHGNEYEAPEEGESYDPEELMESTEGLEVAEGGS